MKKFVFFIVVIFVALLTAGQVRAEIDPLFVVNGCTDPNAVCHVSPEKVTRILYGQQKDDKPCNPNKYQDCTGNPWLPILTQYWQGFVKPLNNTYHYGTDLLKNFGAQIQDASLKDLTPAALQATTQSDVQPKRFCVVGRICVYDPQNHGLLFLDQISSDTYCTQNPDDPPKRRELIEGTRRLASYTTQYSTGTDYRLPETVVKRADALPCPATWDPNFRSMDENTLKTRGQNTYDLTTTFSDLMITGDVTTSSSPCPTLFNPDRECWFKHEITPAKELGSAENSMAGSLAGISFTVTLEDLKPFDKSLSPDAIEQLTKVGGLWNTYRNEYFDPAFKTPLDARYDTQQWDVTITGFSPTTAPTQQSMNARQENAQLFGNLSIIPAALQHVFFPSLSTALSWLNPSYRPPSGFPPSPSGTPVPGTTPGPGTPGPGTPGPGTPGPGTPGPGTPGPGTPGPGTPGPSGAPGTWNCDVNASPAPVPGLNSDAGKSYADNVFGSSCSSGTANAWVPCENDVIARAQKACVDPTFALAIWLHETGASNYQCVREVYRSPAEDFGYHVSGLTENFSAQLDGFLRLPDAYAARCPGKTMRDFISLFWFGDQCYDSETSDIQAKIDGYIGELQDIYAAIAPDKSLPDWPKGNCSN